LSFSEKESAMPDHEPDPERPAADEFDLDSTRTPGENDESQNPEELRPTPTALTTDAPFRPTTTVNRPQD
jgi:hypothetical protein